MCNFIESKGFDSGMEYLLTIETYEKDWLWIWENAEDYKQFEKEFKAEDPKAFKHFINNVLVNHLNTNLN